LAILCEDLVPTLMSMERVNCSKKHVLDCFFYGCFHCGSTKRNF